MRRRRIDLCLLVVTAVAVFSSLIGIWNHYCDRNDCTMSYSSSVYYPIPFVSHSSKVGSKYKLLFYREGGISTHYEHPDDFGGIPVLFLPGNAGSPNQGRSFASQAATVVRDANLDMEFDFFMVDFSEDLSAMHGKTLFDQAAYANDAIAHILRLYQYSTDTSVPPPQSVIILSHSMGGIVARTLVTLPNYVNGSVNTILTLSTPHAVPPLTFDRDVTAVYDLVNRHWRENPDPDMALVSLAGGHGDRMVMPDYTAVDSLVPVSNGFSAISYGIPGVWLGIDHLAIAWCAEFRDSVIDAFVAIAAPTSPQRTLPIQERMAALRDRFFSPIEGTWIGQRLSITPRISGLDPPMGNLAFDSRGAPAHYVLIDSISELMYSGLEVTLESEFTDIELPVHSSLLALKVDLDTPTPDVGFRHWYPGDSRWYMGQHNTVLWYSAGPFVPYNTTGSELHLQVISPKGGVANIRIAWFATFANIAMRYRTLLAVYPVAIICICMLLQLKYKLASFDASFDLFVSRCLIPLSLILALIHVLLGSNIILTLVRCLQMPSERLNIQSLREVGFEVHDVLIGTKGMLLMFVPCMLLMVSTVAVRAVDRAARIVVTLNQKIPLPSFKWIHRVPPLTLGSVIAGISAVVLLIVPYQVVFVGIALFQLLRVRDHRSIAYTHLLLLLWIAVIDSPILAIWVKNFNWRWTIAFSTFRNLLSAAPTVALVAILGRVPLERAPCQEFTYSVLGYIAAYAILFGALHTFMLHHLVNYLSGWLLVSILLIKDSESLRT